MVINLLWGRLYFSVAVFLSEVSIPCMYKKIEVGELELVAS
jgi:hypothetical protein